MRRRVQQVSATAALLVTVIVGCISPQRAVVARPPAAQPAAPTLADRLDAFVRALVVKHAFSGAVLVVRHGVVLLDKGYGWADVVNHRPNMSETEFHIGSLTKQFTAAALLLLQAQGKLRVTDHVCRYLPACPRAWHPITVRELLTHTSGIPNYTDLPFFNAIIRQPTTPSALIAAFKDLPLAFTPGSRFSYSNSNYVLLGYIVSQVSGLSYGAYLQKYLFTALHLGHTGYEAYRPWAASHARGYQIWGTLAPPYDMTEIFAAGGLYSTVGDLYRWDQALLQGPPLFKQVGAQMMTPAVSLCSHQCGGPISQASYGYGLYVGTFFGEPMVYHPGNVNGFSARNLMHPRVHDYVIVLSNLDAPAETAFPLDAMLLGEQLPAGFGA